VFDALKLWKYLQDVRRLAEALAVENNLDLIRESFMSGLSPRECADRLLLAQEHIEEEDGNEDAGHHYDGEVGDIEEEDDENVSEEEYEEGKDII
jgi:hypothetical protein